MQTCWDVRLWYTPNEISTYCCSSISKPIQKNPIRVTLCWGARPAASCCISFRANSRRTSCRVVAGVGSDFISYVWSDGLTFSWFVVWILSLRIHFPALDHPRPSRNGFCWERSRELIKDLRMPLIHQHSLLETLRKQGTFLIVLEPRLTIK